MAYPSLYRKRIMPDECIFLKDDIILECNDEFILTKWNALKPKKDLHHGYSCYYLKQGFKISKFLKEDDSLLYWYCDIVEYQYDPVKNSLTTLDLLADVIVCPDGFVRVLDLDELAVALGDGRLEDRLLKQCLLRLNRLLQLIYDGKFHTLKLPVEEEERRQ